MATILVVDDEQDVADAVKLVLQNDGYFVLVAKDMASARDILSTGEVDACVLDVWIDGDTGLDLATEISRDAEPVPFVMMSGGGPGRSLESATAKADALGAAEVLFKPFDDDELLAAVKKALGA